MPSQRFYFLKAEFPKIWSRGFIAYCLPFISFESCFSICFSGSKQHSKQLNCWNVWGWLGFGKWLPHRLGWHLGEQYPGLPCDRQGSCKWEMFSKPIAGKPICLSAQGWVCTMLMPSVTRTVPEKSIVLFGRKGHIGRGFWTAFSPSELDCCIYFSSKHFPPQWDYFILLC